MTKTTIKRFKSKTGFALPFAIMVLFIMGTLGVYSIYITSQTVKLVVDEDAQIQLKLYANSAEELDLLWLSEDKKRSQNNSELNISFEKGKYNFYIYNWATSLKDIPESNGTVVVDITGYTYIGDEKRRITKRVVQKP